MVLYRRNLIAGGTYFFTATLFDRASRDLTDNIEALRAAVRTTRKAHPFLIDAIVVLPDHLHVLMTLPEGDADFSNRLSLIKRRFTDSLLKTVFRYGAIPTANMRCGSGASGNIPFVMKETTSGTWTTSTSILSNTVSSAAQASGRTHRFISMCEEGFCR
jgi:REP element-mobilizing transposase RayT